MEETDGEDLLRGQLFSLRRRVEELEQENQRLLSQISRCRCSKERHAKSHAGELASSNGTSKTGTQCNVSHEVSEPATRPDNSFTSPSTSAKERFHHLQSEKAKLGLEDRPGCQPSTMQVCSRRYVALKIMYFGKRFYGFASEAQMDPTIESEVFKALKRTKLLVDSRAESKYSRCGRTDKGVSSSGQVISLYLRSNLKDTGTGSNPKKQEIDYLKVLNRVLPPDIRVIGWCPVSTDFSARFSCLSREYRYLFWRGTLDIVAMQKAAEKFIGEHDFRNFCKMDAANVKNYKRRITKFCISPCNQRFDVDELWAITIKGSAFLWHQVRCMVAVLFMIGQGLESADVLDVLLDTQMTPRKPQYTMAPELPLILRFCEFEDVNFICSSGRERQKRGRRGLYVWVFWCSMAWGRGLCHQDLVFYMVDKPATMITANARRALQEHLTSELQTYMLQAAIYHETLSCLSTAEESPPKPGKIKRGHVSLVLRPTEPSFEERHAKLYCRTTHES